ncbi:F-box protein At5g50450-like [Lolium perenne]|uniref:F-box protein At5g50450-like n=1 Tax=Lolium perenne TaxID=4522 RepID=UPI003A9A364F
MSIDDLPDGVIAAILEKVAASARLPADFLSATMTSKRFTETGRSRSVLKKVSARCFDFSAKKWSDGPKTFLQTCAEAGNLDASYILGMITFYCVKLRADGVAKISLAATGGHKDAIYAMAVIMFNGSGAGEESRDIHGATHLCAHAASLGHVIALRELGFCIHDGYGIERDTQEGRRLVALARAREMAEALDDHGSLLGQPTIANKFMVEWFRARDETQIESGNGDDVLHMCSNRLCGRQETRIREFRQCSLCAMVQYCSRACQARHWSQHAAT